MQVKSATQTEMQLFSDHKLTLMEQTQTMHDGLGFGIEPKLMDQLC